MPSRNDLIRALQDAYQTEEEKKTEPSYKYEETAVGNQHASRLLDIKPTMSRARELSGEMVTINSLSKFFMNMNNETSRKAYTVLKKLCDMAEEDAHLFIDVHEIAKDVTDRLRSLTPDSPQRQMIVLYAANCLDVLMKEATERLEEKRAAEAELAAKQQAAQKKKK